MNKYLFFINQVSSNIKKAGGNPSSATNSLIRSARGLAAATDISAGLNIGGAAMSGFANNYNINTGAADSSKALSTALLGTNWNNTSTTGLMNLWNSTLFAPHVTWRLLRGSKGLGALGVLGSMESGAAAGGAAGPWGMLAGAVAGLGTGLAGWFSGKKKAKRLANSINALADAANLRTINNMRLNALNILTGMIDLYNRNWVAFGGDLSSPYIVGPAEYDIINNLLRIAEKRLGLNTGAGLSNKQALGGTLLSNGSNFTTGLSHIDAGSTHEQNPYEGVPMGTDNLGVPNFVEEGETIYKDYVFSNRLTVPMLPKKKSNKKANGGKLKEDISYEERVLKPYLGLTFSEAAKKIEKAVYGEGGNLNGKLKIQYTNQLDKQDTLDALLAVLAETQERLKQEEQAKQLLEMIANMSPEELLALLQLLAAAQLLEMLQQLAVEQQAIQEQLMALLGASPEEIAAMEQLLAMELLLQPLPQEQPLMSPEEAAALEQQLIAMLLLAIQGYALGGNLNKGNMFAIGGLTRTQLRRLGLSESYLSSLLKEYMNMEDNELANLLQHSYKLIRRAYGKAGLNFDKFSDNQKKIFYLDLLNQLLENAKLPKNERTLTTTKYLQEALGDTSTISNKGFDDYATNIVTNLYMNSIGATEIPLQDGRLRYMFNGSPIQSISPDITIKNPITYDTENNIWKDVNGNEVLEPYKDKYGFSDNVDSSYDYDTYINALTGETVDLPKDWGDKRGNNKEKYVSYSWYKGDPKEYIDSQLYKDFVETWKKDILAGNSKALERLKRLDEYSHDVEGGSRYFDTDGKLKENWIDLFDKATLKEPVAQAMLAAKKSPSHISRFAFVDKDGKLGDNPVYLSSNVAQQYPDLYKLFQDEPISRFTDKNGKEVRTYGIVGGNNDMYITIGENGKPYFIPEDVRSLYEVYTPDEPFEVEKNIPGYEGKITYLRKKLDPQKNSSLKLVMKYPNPRPDWVGGLAALTGGIGALLPPDYSRSIAMLTRGYFTPRIVPERIPDPAKPKLIDPFNLMNLVALLTATALGNIRNSGVNQGSKNAALIAAGHLGLVNQGNALIAGILANNTFGKDWYTLLLSARHANQSAQLEADRANLQAFRAGDLMIALGYGLAEQIDLNRAKAASAGLLNTLNTAYRNRADRLASDLLAWYLMTNSVPMPYIYKDNNNFI